MIGQFYIDGIDVYDTFKICINDGGLKELISYASLKSFDINDWPDEDGIEPDLSNPVLDSKSLTITFGCSDSSLTENFIVFLSDMSYHEFNFSFFSFSARLRLESQPDKETFGSIEAFSLSFADDFPLRNYVYQAPINGFVQNGFLLDDKKISDYGIFICDGYYDEVLKAPAVKKKLTINYSGKSGLIYDNSNVVYQSKECKLTCVLKANSLSDFGETIMLFYSILLDQMRGY